MVTTPRAQADFDRRSKRVANDYPGVHRFRRVSRAARAEPRPVQTADDETRAVNVAGESSIH
jgi:hypothetical protein